MPSSRMLTCIGLFLRNRWLLAYGWKLLLWCWLWASVSLCSASWASFSQGSSLQWEFNLTMIILGVGGRSSWDRYTPQIMDSATGLEHTLFIWGNCSTHSGKILAAQVGLAPQVTLSKLFHVRYFKPKHLHIHKVSSSCRPIHMWINLTGNYWPGCQYYVTVRRLKWMCQKMIIIWILAKLWKQFIISICMAVLPSKCFSHHLWCASIAH